MKLPYCFFYLILFVIYLTDGKVHAQCAEKDITNLRKTALVFGEKAYKHCSELTNPSNDANDISDSLSKVGFKVFTYYDKDLESMRDLTNQWVEKLSNYDVAVFYFSGHGAEVNGENFLFPIDINPKSPSDLAYKAFSANQMLDRLDSKGLKYSVIILDACRNNPFTRSWNRDISDKGLASMTGKGSFIAFAASPGKTASDGNNRNGTYTEGILKYITVPNLTITQIFTRVNAYVQKNSGGDQIPFYNSSLSTEYCFSVTGPKTSLKSQYSTYFALNSSIALSFGDQNLFTIEDNGEGVAVRDPNSLNILSIIKNGVQNVNLIAVRKGNTVFLADSVKRICYALDWKNRKILDSIKTDFSPLAIIPSIDERKLYILGNNNKTGVLLIVNLQSMSMMKTLSFDDEISNLCISTDGKRLFAASKNGKLNVVDTKSEKIIRQIEGLDISGAIGITPDDKKLYGSNRDAKSITVIDLKGYQSSHIDNVTAAHFGFSNDSQFLFAFSGNRISMINTTSNELYHVFPFASEPKGIVFSTDGTGFVWLPKENRVFTISLADTSTSLKVERDLDLKLKKFKEKINNDPAAEKIKKQNELCARISKYSQGIEQAARQTVGNLVAEFNVMYRMTSEGGLNTNCQKLMGDFYCGIGLVSDQKKAVTPLFRYQFNDDQIVLTIMDARIDKEAETRTFVIDSTSTTQKNGTYFSELPLNQNEFEIFKKFIRDYFIKRLDYIEK